MGAIDGFVDALFSGLEVLESGDGCFLAPNSLLDGEAGPGACLGVLSAAGLGGGRPAGEVERCRVSLSPAPFFALAVALAAGLAPADLAVAVAGRDWAEVEVEVVEEAVEARV